MTTAETNDRLLEETRLGQEAFERHVRPRLRPEDTHKFVAVDIDGDDFEIDSDDDTAIERLLARKPGTRVWLTRAGHKAAYQMRGVAGQ